MLPKQILNKIKSGSVFIYPTDTIYGIGCNALNKKSVDKIRKIKLRESKPFSVIAPSKEWILKNCILNKEYLKKLPGPYTFILKLKKNIFPYSLNFGKNTIGVRIPNHWISLVASKLNIPIVTTSVNLSGKPYMTSMKNLNPVIKNKVDLILYEGKLKNKPSTVIDLINKPKVLR